MIKEDIKITSSQFRSIIDKVSAISNKISGIGKSGFSRASVTHEQITETSDGQRIDNFLFRRFRAVPKGHIYQVLRSGQVRVNGGRVKASYHLQLDDIVRIPPIKKSENTASTPVSTVKNVKPYVFSVIFEDDALLIINKPAGLAVHGGSGVSFGVIEQLRHQHPNWKFLELVHRLDRETSGVLLLSKKRAALVDLHRQIREGRTNKYYSVLVKGKWNNMVQHVKLPLVKYVTTSGERRVAVSNDKQQANKVMSSHTIFRLQKAWDNFSLLQAELKTGRTHQIRVHLAHLSFPIIGDDKYGDFKLNKRLAKSDSQPSLTRMFLHASKMQITHPLSGQCLQLEAPLSEDLQKFVTELG